MMQQQRRPLWGLFLAGVLVVLTPWLSWASVSVTQYKAERVSGNTVRISWSTGSENEHSRFVLWRSTQRVDRSNPDQIRSAATVIKNDIYNSQGPCQSVGQDYVVEDTQASSNFWYYLESYSCDGLVKTFEVDPVNPNTAAQPSATATDEPEPTETSRPGATNTVAAATATRSPTRTNTRVPSATSEPSNTPAPTTTTAPGQPTSTPAPSATNTTTVPTTAPSNTAVSAAQPTNTTAANPAPTNPPAATATRPLAIATAPIGSSPTTSGNTTAPTAVPPIAQAAATRTPVPALPALPTQPASVGVDGGALPTVAPLDAGGSEPSVEGQLSQSGDGSIGASPFVGEVAPAAPTDGGSATLPEPTQAADEAVVLTNPTMIAEATATSLALAAVLGPTAQPIPTMVGGGALAPNDGSGGMNLLIWGMVGLGVVVAVGIGAGTIWYMRQEGH